MNPITDIVTAQRNFFLTGATKNIAFRKQALVKLKGLIAEHEADITAALQSDLGRSGYESFITENIVAFDELNAAIKQVEKWAAPKKVSTPPQLFYSKSHIQYEPLGLVLIIAPWNFPFHLSFAPLAGAIAAGNCCIIKPSELAPHSSAVIAKIINHHFPAAYLKVCEGGHETVDELLQHRFDHIFFTGSTDNGRRVYVKAAQHLTPVTMELGGKCPCIVHSDANIETGVKRIAWGKFLNSGQTCLAPDYVLVHKDIKEKFLSRLVQVIREFYGDNVFANADWPRMINLRQFERAEGFLKNGKLFAGGNTDRQNLKIEPTVLTGVNMSDAVMQEEIFAPVLPVLEYDTISEAIEKINGLAKPLAVYAFTNNRAVKEKIIAETSSGAVVCNECLMHGANGNLPFGGVGLSGIGKYHHRFSFEKFSNAKGVFNRSIWPDPGFRYPPYAGKSLSLMKKFI